jgi:hypothetical protein
MIGVIVLVGAAVYGSISLGIAAWSVIFHLEARRKGGGSWVIFAAVACFLSFLSWWLAAALFQQGNLPGREDLDLLHYATIAFALGPGLSFAVGALCSCTVRAR